MTNKVAFGIEYKPSDEWRIEMVKKSAIEYMDKYCKIGIQTLKAI